MKILGTHIPIMWDSCVPFFYGNYEGKLKDGRDCKIDVDWKIQVFVCDTLEQVGTDEVRYWLCDAGHINSMLQQLEA